MRLTLRTMLAYMDGLLEPEDAEDIRKKIEASKSATDIFHQIREGMRRLRLTAPSLSEHGSGLDPNTVADYLDNVLPGDKVPDFEKVCLESPVHLAEVAACHQILALVLGEPAEINPASRERMYRIPQVAGQAEEERQAAAAAAAMLSGDGLDRSPAGLKRRARPGVPEYLREPRKRRLLPIAAALLLFGGMLGILLVALRQFEPGTPLGRLIERLRGQSEVAGAPEEPSEPAAPPAATPSPTDSKAKEEPSPATGTGAAGKPSPEQPAPKPPPAEKGKPGEEPSAVSPAHGGGLPEKTAAGPQGKPEAPGQPRAKEVAKPPVGPEKPAGPEKTVGPPPPVAEPAAQAVRIGRVFPDALEVLLRYNADTATWTRAAPEEFLQSGQPLLALPTYRPRVVILNLGVTAELLSGTQIELLGPDAEGRPGIDVLFGRVVLKPLAQGPARLRLTGGGRSGALTLTSVESICALEVLRVQPPGEDPQTHPSGAVATLYVAQGAAVWQDDAGGRTVRLPAPAQWAFESSPAAAPKTLPKWIVTDTVNPLDRRASATVAEAFAMDRPASLVLMEMAEHRQVEVRWLATRCLAYLGQFEPMVAALDDKTLRWQWPEYIDQLRQAAVRGPASAAAVRQALEKRYGASGLAMYRMLWGYTDRQLANKEDARLVNDLAHETLAVRVLAFWNLKEITGTGFFYRPEDPAQKRQQAMQRWKQLQEAGGIRTKTAEEKSRVAADPTILGLEKPAAPEKPAVGEKPAAGGPADPKAVPEPPLPNPPPPTGVVVPEPPVDPAPESSGTPPAGAEGAKPEPAGRPQPPRSIPPEPAPDR
jgi:hypothetical protein